MSRRPAGSPKRWTEGGAQDALSRRAAALFDVAPPAPLGAERRGQIARRLAASAPHAHAGLVLLAKATGVVGIAAGIAVGVARYTSTSTPPRQTEAVLVAPSSPAPVATTPKLEPIPAKPASPSRIAPPSPIPAPSSRSHGPRGTTKLAVNTPARSATIPHAARDVEPPPPIPSVSQAPPRLAPGSAPASTSIPRAVSQPEAYARPPMTHEEEPAAPPAPRSEPRLLADALASLHARDDAKGALTLLAEHRRRFPHGALRSEARVAEVEALLALHRRSDALRILDGMAIERAPRDSELAVLRAELRAQTGRCTDAIADFDRCAAAGGCSPELHERALFGRASCRRKLGQTAAARADLERYVRRFPHGWRSEAVRRALAEK